MPETAKTPILIPPPQYWQHTPLFSSMDTLCSIGSPLLCHKKCPVLTVVCVHPLCSIPCTFWKDRLWLKNKTAAWLLEAYSISKRDKRSLMRTPVLVPLGLEGVLHAVLVVWQTRRVNVSTSSALVERGMNPRSLEGVESWCIMMVHHDALKVCHHANGGWIVTNHLC